MVNRPAFGGGSGARLAVFSDLLLWLHVVALAVGVGGGLVTSQIGLRLVAAAPDQRAAWRPLVRSFSLSAGAGLGLLLVTGPLLVRLESGAGGFAAQTALVPVAVATLGLGEWGLARLERGDEGGGRLMRVSGPLTLVVVVTLAFAAAATFS